nr:hypothetical protein Iba_chr11bCG17930 [Ipomoea batatas]GMD59210.1 hypothetical protein Iba_chr11fCG12960 [Ipomoea batatas]
MDQFPRLQQDNTHFSRSKSLHLPDLSNNESSAKTHGSAHECDQEDGAGEIFGVILSRSRSVSSGAAPRESTTKAEKQKKGLAKVTLAMKSWKPIDWYKDRISRINGDQQLRRDHQQSGASSDNINYFETSRSS